MAVPACQDPSNESFRSNFRIKRVDAPAIYDAVNIAVLRVFDHRAGAGPSVGWKIIGEDLRIFDLLGLRNGVSAMLASGSLPAGRYDKFRVLFGISSVIDDGCERSVMIPSDLADGANIDVAFEVMEGGVTGLSFDFDVSRSLRTTSDGRFALRPVIRVQRSDLAGSIAGGVVPDSVLTLVTTVAGSDAVRTYSVALPGLNSFQLVDLPEGTYHVTLHAGHPGFVDTLLSDVKVMARQTTPLGAIVLRPLQP